MSRHIKCQFCGALHDKLCPHVKVIEYFPSGTIKRVEFKCAGDFVTPAVWPSTPYPPVYTPTIPQSPWVVTSTGLQGELHSRERECKPVYADFVGPKDPTNMTAAH